MAADPFTDVRSRLAESVRASTRILNDRIISAIASVPRHLFVAAEYQPAAYEDRALPLSDEQTISQPSMIAIMLEQLDPGPEDRVLEVGAGSGYAAALLGHLAAEVHAIEIRPALARSAQQLLTKLGYHQVHIHTGDGSRGLPEHSPFDRILVSAGALEIPQALLAQLAPGGRIAIPVGGAFSQSLMIGVKTPDGKIHWNRTTPCVFVPLVTSARETTSDPGELPEQEQFSRSRP